MLAGRTSGMRMDFKRWDGVVRWLLKLWRLGKMACALVARVLRGGQRVAVVADGGLRVEDPVGRDEHVRGKLVALGGEPCATARLDPSSCYKRNLPRPATSSASRPSPAPGINTRTSRLSPPISGIPKKEKRRRTVRPRGCAQSAPPVHPGTAYNTPLARAGPTREVQHRQRRGKREGHAPRRTSRARIGEAWSGLYLASRPAAAGLSAVRLQVDGGERRRWERGKTYFGILSVRNSARGSANGADGRACASATKR